MCGWERQADTKNTKGLTQKARRSSFDHHHPCPQTQGGCARWKGPCAAQHGGAWLVCAALLPAAQWLRAGFARFAASPPAACGSRGALVAPARSVRAWQTCWPRSAADSMGAAPPSPAQHTASPGQAGPERQQPPPHGHQAHLGWQHRQCHCATHPFSSRSCPHLQGAGTRPTAGRQPAVLCFSQQHPWTADDC